MLILFSKKYKVKHRIVTFDKTSMTFFFDTEAVDVNPLDPHEIKGLDIILPLVLNYS